MLAKYNFVLDEPGSNQVAYDGTLTSPWQRSHILSLDATYDLNQKLSIGAKYGMLVLWVVRIQSTMIFLSMLPILFQISLFLTWRASVLMIPFP